MKLISIKFEVKVLPGHELQSGSLLNDQLIMIHVKVLILGFTDCNGYHSDNVSLLL